MESGQRGGLQHQESVCVYTVDNRNGRSSLSINMKGQGPKTALKTDRGHSLEMIYSGLDQDSNSRDYEDMEGRDRSSMKC